MLFSDVFEMITNIVHLDFMIYIFGSFAMYGIMLLLRKLIFHKGI